MQRRLRCWAAGAQARRGQGRSGGRQRGRTGAAVLRFSIATLLVVGGQTPLLLAASQGHVAPMEVLLEVKADATKHDLNGRVSSNRSLC